MTALVDHSDALRKLTGGDSGVSELIWLHRTKYNITGTVQGVINGRPLSYWGMSGQPGHGIAPGATARNPTNATAGALGQTNPTGGRQKFITALHATFPVNGAGGTYWIADRLADISGLVANIATLQSITGLSVTRYSGGAAAGNQIVIEVFATIGSTVRTLTVTYTNEAGVSGRTGTAWMGGSGVSWMRLPNCLSFVQLQAGDRGVQSVESVQLDASTGTAGDFAVTIVRPLAPFVFYATGPGGGGRDMFSGPFAPVEVLPNACLFAYGYSHASNVNQLDIGVQFVES